MKQCQNCKKDFDDAMKFCPYCGTSAAVETEKTFCGNCGAKLEVGTKFCPSCGVTIQTGEASSALPVSLESVEWTSSAPPDAIVLTSSAPIPSKTGWTTWAYIISAVLIVAGGFGVLCLIGVFVVEHYMMVFHRGKIRDMKFKFVDNATVDDIYTKLQPALIRKLGNSVLFDRDGDTLSVEYDSIIYDINLHDDSTFSVWWRKSIAGAIFSFNDWKLYRKIRSGTALVAYELQQQFGIK